MYLQMKTREQGIRISEAVSWKLVSPLFQQQTWDKPYKEGIKPDRFNLPDILAGKWDAYIDQWADAARDYGKPLLVTWGLEMNGIWFPWSGFYYGGGKIVGKRDGRPLYAGTETLGSGPHPLLLLRW